MARLKTYDEMVAKLTRDLDLVNEPFIDSDELLGYINEGIEEAETAIHTLGLEDSYFLSFDFINLVSGQSVYDPPANIYANKIRKILYSSPVQSTVMNGTLTTASKNVTVASTTGLLRGMVVIGTGIPATTKVASVSGVTVVLSQAATVSGAQSLTFLSMPVPVGNQQYEVRKCRNLLDAMAIQTGAPYGFLIMNLEQEAGGNQIQVFPPPTESGPLLMVLYIRRLRALTTTANDPYNVCELSECVNFVYQHVKWNAAKKRRIPELIATEAAALRVQYGLMQETFKEMIPDENNKVQLDLSAYRDQETDIY